jgi:phage gp45-like
VEQREIMSDLLESVQTERLSKSFEKYMPSVIAGNTPAKDTKATLTEGTQITGNKETNDMAASTNSTDNVVDLRRLAGLK